MSRTVVLDEYGNCINQLTQWDLNRSIVINDFEYDANPIFHFCNRSSTEALVVESNLNDKKVISKIPNELLESTNTILVYICLCDNEKNIVDTIDYFELPVRKRPKPKDYMYVQNIEYIRISDLKNQLDEFLKISEQSFKKIEDDFNSKKAEIDTVITNAETATTNANNAVQSTIEIKETIEEALSNGDFNGTDGISIINAQIVENDLIVSLSNGNEINAGKVRDSAKRYGVCYDMNTKNPKLTRLGDAKYLQAKTGVGEEIVHNDFDNIYPWSDMKRCTLSDSGVVTSYEGDPNYIEDGSIGQVVTRMPEHYQMHYISEETGKEYWYVSREKVNEYYHYVPEMYIGSFMISNDANDKGESKSGNVYYENYTISDGRTKAMARGNGWHIFDIWEYEALKTLFIIEFATLDSQSVLMHNDITKGISETVFSDPLYYSTENDPSNDNVIGNAFYSTLADLFVVGDEIILEVVNNETPEELDYDGYAIRKITNVEEMGDVVWEENTKYYKYTFGGSSVEMAQEFKTGYNHTRNGITNQILSSTGHIMTLGCALANVWRGIENFVGEDYTWIDGILIYDNKYWVCNDISKYANTIYVYNANGEITEDYQYSPLPFLLPRTGYITKMGYDETTGITLPAETGGTSDTAFCDNFHSPRLNTAISLCRFGSGIEFTGGLFNLHCFISASSSTASCARISYRH